MNNANSTYNIQVHNSQVMATLLLVNLIKIKCFILIWIVKFKGRLMGKIQCISGNLSKRKIMHFRYLLIMLMLSYMELSNISVKLPVKTVIKESVTLSIH